METVEVVIRIPEEWIEQFKAFKHPSTLETIILQGTVLPKGHGDLITKEQAIDLVEFYQINPQHFDFVNLIEEIKDKKPIIEADREVSE